MGKKQAYKTLENHIFTTAGELLDYLDFIDDTLDTKKIILNPPLNIRLVNVPEETGVEKYGYELVLFTPDIDI